MKIDLACGNSKKEGYIGVDITETPSVDIVHDLTVYPWPFEDSSVDEIHCSHYIEHIKHDNVAIDLAKLVNESSTFEEFKSKINDDTFTKSDNGFIRFINELYRILKPKGEVTIIAPYYSSMRAFSDPTHTRYISDLSFYYLNKEWRNNIGLNHYGITCDFDVEFSYHITEEMTLKSEEVRNKAFTHDLNVIDDIIVKLIKR
jgi:predicted SAM-dependent methyltransferase